MLAWLSLVLDFVIHAYFMHSQVVEILKMVKRELSGEYLRERETKL